MRLSAKRAVVRTAHVEIRALSIEGKQVTLAVFRQLERADLFDAAFEFRGQAWGRVNYHPDCSAAFDHAHIVWQDGDMLRRATFYAQAKQDVRVRGAQETAQRTNEKLREAATAWADLATRRHWVTRNPEYGFRALEYTYPEGVSAADAHDGQNVRCERHGVITSGMLSYRSADVPESPAAVIAAADQRYRVTADQWRGARRELERMQALHAERWSQIMALDQLFIAV